MLYGFLKGILPTMFRIIYRAEVHGQENVPKEGGAIIAANHISLWDPPFVGAFCPRRVSFMAKKELFENSVFSSIITSLGAFPVNRGAADRNAIKTALTVLGEGKCLGLFPEGTRSKNGNHMLPFHGGTFKSATKSKCTILPFALIDSFKVLDHNGVEPVTVQLHYLKPIPYEEYKDMNTNEIAAMVHDRIENKLVEVGAI